MYKILMHGMLQINYSNPNFFSTPKLEKKRLNAEEKNMTQNPCVICWSGVRQTLPLVYVSGSMTVSNKMPTNRREPCLKSNIRPFSHNRRNHVALLQKREKREILERFRIDSDAQKR